MKSFQARKCLLHSSWPTRPPVISNGEVVSPRCLHGAELAWAEFFCGSIANVSNPTARMLSQTHDVPLYSGSGEERLVIRTFVLKTYGVRQFLDCRGHRHAEDSLY
jgi:hypothetical protein